MTKRRNAQALAAKARKGGPHETVTDRLDRIETFEEREMLAAAADIHARDFGVDDYVRVVTTNSAYLDEVGRIVIESKTGMWGVVFGAREPLYFLTRELERA